VLIASYLSASRALLGSMRHTALLIVMLGGFVGVFILILFLVRRFLWSWRSSKDAGVIGGVAAMVLTLFALLLAFGIVTLYDQRQAAQNAIVHEADDLVQVERDATVLQGLGARSKEKTRVDFDIRNYVCDIKNHEFPAMRNGTNTLSASGLATIFKDLSGEYAPVGNAQNAFFLSAVSQLNDAVAQRRDRLGSVNASLPYAFAGLLISTAVIGIILTCFIRTAGTSKDGEPSTAGTGKDGDPHGRVEYVLVASVAFVVAAGLLTALMFEFPFSGPLAITNYPLPVKSCP
jgi:hypothetical protein